MYIKENVIKHYLKNCYFINGTAYAGKSTTCKALAEKYDMVHCEENYNTSTIFSLVNKKDQPGLNYFNTKESWEAYIMRTPREVNHWFKRINKELMSFEIAELIRISQNRKVIVDTNIPLDVLQKIAEPHQIAVMLSPPEISETKFFDREDPEKQFILQQINQCKDPEFAYKNFLAGIRLSNEEAYNDFKKSNVFILERGFDTWLSLDETIDVISKHFRL